MAGETKLRAPRSSKALAIPEPDPARYSAATELAGRAPEHSVVGNVRSGTAGWTDPTLVRSAVFYPKKTMSARERLEHYARHFSFVEVNATYYSLLPPENAVQWLVWKQAGLVLNVQA